MLLVTTTDCECCFSAVNHIKTELRNRMNTNALYKLLRIHMEGPDMSQFDFKEAVKRWQKSKNCRRFFPLTHL